MVNKIGSDCIDDTTYIEWLEDQLLLEIRSSKSGLSEEEAIILRLIVSTIKDNKERRGK